jgi:hypothetical protein
MQILIALLSLFSFANGEYMDKLKLTGADVIKWYRSKLPL